MANGSIDGKTRLGVVLQLSAAPSIGATGCREPRPESQENPSVELTSDIVLSEVL